MKPKIGIVGSIIGDTFGVTTPYMHFASLLGDVYILTPDTPILDLDLLILRGGADLSPANYGQKPGYVLSNSNPFLEEFDNEKLPQYIQKKTPIFGICRGMQSINVYFGGTLKQHIQGHPTNDDGLREEPAHKVRNIEEKHGIVFEVNSMHHQAVDELGEGLEKTHIAIDDKKKSIGIIEGIKHKTLPIICVQWHPEEIMDDYSLSACKSLICPN